MSYTRFGPDSDVFVYASVQNTLVISVSRTRFVPHPDRPLPVKPESTNVSADHYERALAEYREAVDRGSYEPIGGLRDGLSYQVSSPGEGAALLRALREEGYRVPDKTLAVLDTQERTLAAARPTATLAQSAPPLGGSGYGGM